MVCEGLRQARIRISFAWKVKTMPMRELKRRKLVDIWGRENSGFSVRVWPVDGAEESSVGITCCNNLLSVSLRFPTSFHFMDWVRERTSPIAYPALQHYPHSSVPSSC